jgi:hypothetical protein
MAAGFDFDFGFGAEELARPLVGLEELFDLFAERDVLPAGPGEERPPQVGGEADRPVEDFPHAR